MKIVQKPLILFLSTPLRRRLQVTGLEQANEIKEEAKGEPDRPVLLIFIYRSS